METTIESVYHLLQSMDKRLERVEYIVDQLSKDYTQLSNSVTRLEGRMDGFNIRFWYLNWLFGAVILLMVAGVIKLFIFPGT